MLGYPHPDYMLEDLTASQLEDWFAWMRRYHPFPDRLDPYFAMQLAMWSKDGRADDFILYRRPEDKFNDDITQEQFSANLRSILPRQA